MLTKLFPNPKPVIGMIHVAALPGTPSSALSVGEIVALAVQEARAHCRLPIILGSGVTVDNLGQFFHLADGFIIGTHFKQDSLWTNTVDPRRVEAIMTATTRLRNSS